MSQSIRQRNELSSYGRIGQASRRRSIATDAVPHNQETPDTDVANTPTNNDLSNERSPKDTDCVRGIVFALVIVLPIYALIGWWLF